MSYFRQNIQTTEAYIPGFQPDAGVCVKLNTNENPFPPSPAVMQAIHTLEPEDLRRYPNPVGEAFRQAAADLHDLSPDWVLCCNGGDDLLTMAFRAFCDELRPVAYPVPTYTLYAVLARLQNCPAVEVPFDDDFRLPEALGRVGAALTIVCNPNAPTGSFIAPAELAELAEKLQGVLLIDEAYVDFAQADCLDLMRKHNNVILLRSMSKGYSLAGLRFGYALACPELIAGLLKVKDSYNVDAVAIKAATSAIRDQTYFQANVKQIKTQRSQLTQGLREMGFTVRDSQANFILAQSEQHNASDLHDELAKRRVYVRYFNYPGLQDKLRITVGTTEQNRQLLSALKEILSQSKDAP